MKKILTLLVAVMMLAMAIPAMAEMVIIQDNMAPEIVAPAEGVVLTDVSERKEESAMAAAFAARVNHDKVVVEMFDVALTVDAPVKVTVKAQAEEAAYTADGLTWQQLAVSVDGENMTFEVPAAGIVALLVNFAEGMFEEITVIEETAVTTEEAEQFVKSVSGKPAPALKKDVFLVQSEEKVTVQPAYLVITPLAKSAASSDVVTHELLQWAYEDIKQNGHREADAEVNSILEGTGLTCDNMVVHDLFETSLYGEYGVKLAEEGVHVEFELDAGFGKGETVVVIYSMDADTWKVLPKENYSLLPDGAIALKMDTLGAIAFLTVMDIPTEAAVTSPAN